jgi:cell wall-associated NlpC family hydrolase
VALSQLAPGDLLYWATDLTNANTIHHVAIYLGNGRMLAAPHSGAFVREENVYWDGFFGATRPAG